MGELRTPSVLFRWSVSVLPPVLHCLDYCTLVVSCEIGRYEVSEFVLLFQDILAILGPLHFHMNVRISLSVSVKKKEIYVCVYIYMYMYIYVCMYILPAKDCIESIDQFEDNGYLNHIEFSDL